MTCLSSLRSDNINKVRTVKERSELFYKDIFTRFRCHRIERFIFSFLLVAALSLFFGNVFFHIHTASAQNAILYVDVDATGNNDGTSWKNAFTDLQSALDVANLGQEIWVAEGIYYPTREVDFDRSGGSDPQEATFQIPSGVEVYGNFAGFETQRNERIWSSNATILSGDIDQDDDVLPDSGNAYHVVYFRNVSADTVLDGFFIRGGNADGNHPNDRGGGIYNDGSYNRGGSNPKISNCVIYANNAGGLGGGIYNEGHQGASSPTITGTIIRGNSAAMRGGGIYNSGWDGGASNPTMIDCAILGNMTGGDGAGIFNDGSQGGESSPRLYNTFIEENLADGDGGGMFNTGWNNGVSNPTLINCVLSANSASWYGGAMVNDGSEDGESSPSIVNCTITGNQAGSAGGGMLNMGTDGTSEPEIINTILWNDRVGMSKNEITNEEANPIFYHCNIENSSVDVDEDDDDWDDSLGRNEGGNIDVEPAFIKPVEFRFIESDSLETQSTEIESSETESSELVAGDYHLQSHSACINAGEDEALPNDEDDLDFDSNVEEVIPIDIDGQPRIKNGVDIGAYEARGRVTINKQQEDIGFAGKADSVEGTFKFENIKITIPENVVPDGSEIIVNDVIATNPFDRIVDIKIKGPDGTFISTLEQPIRVCIQPTATGIQRVSNNWKLLTIFHQTSFDQWNPLDTHKDGKYVCVYSSKLSLFGLALPGQLPQTGFRPGIRHIMPSQPAEKSYQQYDRMLLHIPSLGIEIPIVGVPLTLHGWDVRWLGDNAGYLHSTAFPTWWGNTVITAHVWNFNNHPGPFFKLGSLQKGDQIIIHAWDLMHIYHVSDVKQVRPDALRALAHEEKDVLTLLTCQGYNQSSHHYDWRLAVQAVLVRVENGD